MKSFHLDFYPLFISFLYEALYFPYLRVPNLSVYSIYYIKHTLSTSADLTSVFPSYSYHPFSMLITPITYPTLSSHIMVSPHYCFLPFLFIHPFLRQYFPASFIIVLFFFYVFYLSSHLLSLNIFIYQAVFMYFSIQLNIMQYNITQ